MDSRMAIVEFEPGGTALVSVVNYQRIPVYTIRFLNANATVTLFLNEEGHWQEDGKGVTRLSEQLGERLRQYGMAER